MLPDVDKLLACGDKVPEDKDKLEQTTPSQSRRELKQARAKKIYRGNDLLLMYREAKDLFRPHGLPKQIATLPNFVTFTDGLKLRELCKQIREQHWTFISLRKTQFREKAWNLMRVNRIPCGLRKSFVDSFECYLPEKSQLPIIKDNGLPW